MNNIDKQKTYQVLVSIIFLILISRYFYLQIYKQHQYFQESEKNRIREVVLQPPRGIMSDRNGVVLVDNRPSYSVYAIPFEVKKADSVLMLTGKILNMNVDEITDKIIKGRKGLFTPVKLKRQVDFDVLTRLEEFRMDLPGIIYDTEPRRYYPSGIRAPHLFGYLGEITQNELVRFEPKGYHLGDIVGKKGLERVYDEQLQGLRGYRYIEVDALGREIRSLKNKPEIAPVPGKNLILTIDASLQRFLEMRMDTTRGGVVVVDCRNGEVLALVSKPDYDPELFTKPIPPEIWRDLINNPNKPLYDRMVQSLYPPGSTFKMVLAAAVLENKLITTDFKTFCPGYYQMGRRTFKCWNLRGHGEVNVYDAIEQSCDVFFYKMGLKAGLDLWSTYSKKFRFGELTGIDLIEESAGLVPSTAYFNEKYGENKWSKGLILNLAIGQGELLVTPLQLANYAMILANKGVYHKFHLVRYLEDPIDGSRKYSDIDSMKVTGISDSTYNIIRDGMALAVNGTHSTGGACRFPDIKVAGKTGTAQNPHGATHAWFIGFAPFEKPEIAFCVFVEYGGHGGSASAPIAHGIIQNYLKRDKQVNKFAYDVR
jgi:penicillin-binding protein 2